MPVPSYGAMPLSKTFCFVRILQVLSMIIIIGISANFISMIVSTGVEAPKEFVGTLSVVGVLVLVSKRITDPLAGLHRDSLRLG